MGVAPTFKLAMVNPVNFGDVNVFQKDAGMLIIEDGAVFEVSMCDVGRPDTTP